MIPIRSPLEGQTALVDDARQTLERFGFVYGGNWDYDRGSFDRALDEARKVWLRLPFTVAHGRFDAERVRQETEIRFGTPYVLRHLYREGNDPDAAVMTYLGLVDQFQSPLDPDAPASPDSVREAERLLRQIESAFGK